MNTLTQVLDLRVRALVTGVDQLTGLGNALNLVKAALIGASGAVLVQDLKDMALESDRATKNTQTFTRVMIMYGENAEQARVKTDQFAVSLGISRNVMQENIATLVRSGLTFEEAITATSRALDSASQRGVSTTVALNNLQSAMVTGSSVYLTQLGIIENFDQALAKEAKTLNKTVDAMTPREQALARLNLILKATEAEEGNYLRSMEGIVGQMSKMESVTRDLRREIGGQFLPVFIEGYKAIIAFQQAMLEWVKTSGVVGTVARGVGEAVEWTVTGFYALARIVGEVRDNLDVFRPTVDTLSMAFAPLVQSITDWRERLEDAEKPALTVRGVMESIAAVTERLAEVVLWVSDNWEALVTGLETATVAVGAGAAAWFAFNASAIVIPALLGAIGTAATAAGFAFGLMTGPIGIAAAVAGAFFYAWKTNLGGFRDQMTGAGTQIKKWFTDFTDALDAVAGFLDGVRESVKKFFGQIPDAFDKAKRAFEFRPEDTPLGKWIKFLPNVFLGIIEGIGTVGRKIAEVIRGVRNEQDANDRQDANSNPPNANGDANGATEGGGTIRGARQLVRAVTMGNGTINTTNPYGNDPNQHGYGAAGHDGIDARVGGRGANNADRLYAGFSGYATFKDSGTAGYGKHVELVDALGQTLILAHLKSFDKAVYDAFVKGGNKAVRVNAGTLLGWEGSTGNSTGAHLHLGAKNKYGQLVNPDSLTFQALGGPGTAGGSGRTGAGSDGASVPGAPDPKADAAAREEILRKAESFARQLYALEKRIAKETDVERKAALVSEQKTLQASVAAWAKRVNETQGYVGLFISDLKRIDREAEDARVAAAAAAEKARQDAEKAGGTTAQRRRLEAQGVLDAYKDVQAAAEGNAEKLLAIDRGWREKVIIARKALVRTGIEDDIRSNRAAITAITVGKDGKPATNLSEGQKKQVAEYERMIGVLEKSLPAALARVTSEFDRGLSTLTKNATASARALAEQTAEAGLDAAATIAGTRYRTLERQYLADVELAEGQAAKLLAVEQRWGPRLQNARTAQAKADRALAEQQEEARFARVEEEFRNLGKAVPAEMVAQHEATMSSIAADYRGLLAGNTAYVTDLMKRAREDVVAEAQRAADDESRIAQQTRENQLARGLISWQEFEKSRSAGVINGLRRDAAAATTAAKGNATEQARIARDLTTQIEAERLQSAAALRDYNAGLAEDESANRAQTLENDLRAGRISWERYEQDRLKAATATLERERAIRLRGLEEGSREALAVNASVNGRLEALQLESARTVADRRSGLVQEAAANDQAALDNQLARGAILFEDYERRRLSIAQTSRNAARDAEVRAAREAGQDTAEITERYRLEGERASIESADRVAAYRAGAAAEDAAIDLQALENRLSADLIAWEDYEKGRLALAVQGMETERSNRLRNVQAGSEEARRINADVDGRIQAARLASEKEFATRRTETEETLAGVAASQLQNRFDQGLLSRQEFNDAELTLTLASLERQRATELRNVTLTRDQIAAINARYDADESAARIKNLRDRELLALQIRKEGLASETAAVEQERGAGRLSEAEHQERMLDLTLRRLDLERQAALKENQNGADGAALIWENYWRERAAAARRGTQEASRIELEGQRRVIEQRAAELENGRKSGRLTPEQYESFSRDNQVDALDNARREALRTNLDGLNGQYRIWQDFYAKVEALDLDFAAKQRERAQATTEALNDNARASFQNQYDAGIISTTRYEDAVLGLDQARLNRQYDYAVQSGEYTNTQLLAMWGKLQLDQEALSIAAANRQRDRVLAAAAATDRTEGQRDTNARDLGRLSPEEYEARERERAFRENQRQLTANRGAPGSEEEGAALDAFGAAEDAADIALQKRRAQRAADYRRAQLDLDMEALELRVTQGTVTEEVAARERLRIQQELLGAQLRADLANTELTGRQIEAIVAASVASGKALQAEYDAWTRQRAQAAAQDAASIALSGVQQRYEQGRMGEQEYYAERRRLELDAAQTRYNDELKAAGDNTQMQLNALTRWVQAEKAILFQHGQDVAAMDRANRASIVTAEQAALEEAHEDRLIGDVAYYEKRKELALAQLEIERQAALAGKSPEEQARVNRSFDTARKAIENQARRNVKGVEKAARQSMDAAFGVALAWEQYSIRIREVNEELGKVLEPTQRAALEAEKFAATVQMFGEMARTGIGLAIGALTAFGGMSGQMADEWAEDLNRMVDDAVSMALNIGKALATGNWMGVIVQGLQIIFGWFTRNKRAAQEAARATEDYNKQFLFDKGGYGTRDVEKYTTGFLFWKTDRYKETVDEVGKNLALGFEGAVAGGINSGLRAAVEKGDASLLEKSINESLKDAAFQGLSDAFINSAELAVLMGPLVQKLVDAFKTQNKENIRAALAEFRTGVQAMRGEMEGLVEAGKIVNEELGGSADTMANSWGEGIRRGAQAILGGQDPMQAVYDDIRAKLQQAFMEGFAVKRAMEKMQPFYDELEKALKAGMDPSAALQSILAQAPGVVAQLQIDLSPFTNALNLLPTALGNVVGALNNNTAALKETQFQNTTIVQYGDLGGNSRFRQRFGVN